LKWWLRERWAGRLLLEASSRRNRILFGLMLVFLLAPFVERLLKPAGAHRDNTLLDALPFVFMYALSRRLELRQNGIVVASAFYPWTIIETHSWEGFLDEKAVLKLHVNRMLPFLPPVRIKVPEARKLEVESIIHRYLSEWPQNAVVTPGVPPPLL